MHKEQFQLEISNRFNALEEHKPTIETFHKIMEEEAERFGKNGKDKPNEKLKEDMEIERLDEKRKTLKKKEGKTIAEKIEYTELNKLAKKKRRARKRRKRKEEIEKIIVNGRDKNGGEQDTLLEKKTIDELKDAQSGNQGQKKGTGADRKQNGWMTSEEQQVHNGRGRHKIGGNGRHLQRAISCSG
ncbi:hypothetical protein PoB_003870800 [Plakobranchus ocellatus]|uniref:Uncharacterized protein n=1 Tax=Plakobranchus ocellatus TaxID=259542 RepID=A0AAV4AXZ5_9GAST|nr:hypothetical protein PoB_003870800 [Plakobranchus ocellatus]